MAEAVVRPHAHHRHLRLQHCKVSRAHPSRTPVMCDLEDFGLPEKTRLLHLGVDGLFSVPGDQHVELADAGIRHQTRRVLVVRDIPALRPDDLDVDATYAKRIPAHKGYGLVQHGLPFGHRHRSAHEHPLHPHEPAECRDATVMVVMAVGHEDRIKPPHPLPGQSLTQEERIRSRVHQHGMRTVADERRVPLPDVEEDHSGLASQR